ncbi:MULTISPECIES: DUF4340 domain-containing protein [unclassified Lentimonas]|uniref:DUF4340 domain-containing protein n=1 Tax=unclassified Lentimonas TaxID=2630993 RepID=UPI00132AF9C9|nr:MULTISPECIES: DUF4340 domain-containing protein [unclassified Lentimonas]CAA6677396.1 Unannotated [Lentimonas sp. CC4]CAA6686941.1 Unannotated [Lentimonas sp. CC6]CAA7074642.1 Unannotated [Lentimonas sp. CC4]CAA7169263.1 Unannotated [Lentimonas sp. CC21]CAA7180341.1 Unannotated [Lentimonas sp. CC8]
MRFKFTVFLLALNVITFGLILSLNKKAEQADTKTGGLSGMIGREVIEADRIEINGKSLDAARILESDGSTWNLVQPMQWPANYFAVNRILNQLQFLEEEASFSIAEIERTGQTLADYGLDDPWLTLTISNKDDSIELSVGTTTEIGKNCYLLGPNKKDVFVVNSQVIESLLVDMSDLRNREIFNIPVFEIDALSLQINTPESVGDNDFRVRVARTNNGWIFEAPLTAEADATQVSNTINTLTAAKVVEFKGQETSDPILQGLETPSMRVTLHGNKRRQTLLIGNAVPTTKDDEIPTYFARIEDNSTVFTVAAEPFDKLREAEEALRERSFMNFDSEALTSINLSEGDLQIRLQKLETGGWQVIESNADTDIQPRHADPDVITKLINDIKGLRAIDFAVNSPSPTDLDRLGFNAPRRTVKLSLGDKETTLLLATPESDNNTLYARSDKAEYIYTVDLRSTIQKIPLNAAYYRKRTLETLPKAAKIKSLQLENLATGEVIFNYTKSEDDIVWLKTLKDLPEAKLEATLTLLDTINEFKVKTYLKDEYTDSYYLDDDTSRPWLYRLSAEILLPGDETDRVDTRTYVFTKRFSGSVQVGASELHNVIFEIPQTTIDALYTLTDDMQPPPEASDQPIPAHAPIPPVPTPVPTTSAAEETTAP